ncbi:MAG: hypothetical protein AB7N80_10825 [Bdellovibrionales bacterium]
MGLGSRQFKKAAFRLWLAACVAVAPMHAWAKVPSMIIQSVSDAGEDDQLDLQVSIAFVQEGQEQKVLEEALSNTPNATFTILTGRSAQQGMPDFFKRVQEGGYGPSVQVVQLNEARLSEETKKVLAENKEFKKQYNEALWQPRLAKLRDTGTGLLFTIGSSSGFALSYWYVTGDVSMSNKLFALTFLLNGFQALFTDLWGKYQKMGGQIGQKIHQTIARVLGKTMEAGRVSDDLGRLFAVAGFNVAVATAIMAVQGAFLSTPWIVLLGLIGSWDAIWDLTFGRFTELGMLKDSHQKKFVRYRILFAPAIEAAAYTGGPAGMGAAAIMALIGSTGLVSFFAAKHLQGAIMKRKAALIARADTKRLEVQSQQAAIEARRLQMQTERAARASALRQNEFDLYQQRFGRAPMAEPRTLVCDELLERDAD